MPIFLGLLRGLWVIARPLLMHVLISIGVGMITYAGVGQIFEYALDQIKANIQALPPQAVDLLAVCQFDAYVSIIFSAITIRLTYKGLTAAGALKKIYWTGGAPIVLN